MKVTKRNVAYCEERTAVDGSMLKTTLYVVLARYRARFSQHSNAHLILDSSRLGLYYLIV